MRIIIIILTLTREEGMVNNKNGAVNNWRIKSTLTPTPANRSFNSEQTMLENNAEFLGGLRSYTISLSLTFAGFTSQYLFNPLSPNSDQHQFSSNNIHRLSSTTSMRINQMITKRKISDLLSVSPT